METDLTIAGYIFTKNKVLLIHHKKLNIWIPVGGHIEKNENPDDALKREIKEETNLDIKIFCQSDLPKEGNVKRNLALPFYANIHSAGDHDHFCYFYVCEALNPEKLKINDELINYRWFSIDELNEKIISVDVKNQAIKAFEMYKIEK